MSQPEAGVNSGIVARVLDSLLEGFQIIGPDYRYLYVNETAAAHGHATRDQLVGRAMAEAYPGIERTEMFAVLRRCMDERAPQLMENEFDYPDGSKGWFELRFQPVPEGVAILSMDVSARKRASAARDEAEGRVRHLNAVLRGIRNVNQLITRERDPQQLIHRTCELLVESRGLYSACIVLRDSDRISAWADAGDPSKLESLRRMLARGELPPCMQLALGQRELIVRQNQGESCEDCPVNSAYDAKRDAAALPIMHEDRLFGVLQVTLPAGMGGDPEEVDLLKEIASDVAFALRSIELQAEGKQAEHALARSQTKYRDLVANLEDVVISIDVEGRIQYVSPAIERVYGFSPEETQGRHISEFVHPEDLPGLMASFERALAGAVVPYEFRGHDKQGRLRHLRSSSRVRMRNGRPVGLDGVIIDLTTQRRAEEARTRSEQRYRSLFENATVGIAHCRMIYDGDEPVDFEYVDTNPAFEHLTGLQAVTGRRVTEVIPGIRESDPRLFEIYGRVARNGAPERFEMLVQALHEWFDVSVYSPQTDHFIATFEVITKRKMSEENLLGFSRRLERLTGVLQDLSQARSMEAIVDVVRHAARALAGAEGSTFVLRDGDLCHYVDEDAVSPLWKGSRFPMSSCIAGWAMLRRQAVAIEDIYEDERISQETYRSTFVKSLVVVPIRSQSPIGAIGVYWARCYLASAEDVRILQALADSTSVAVANVRALQELEVGKARTRAIYDHLPNATFVWQLRAGGFVLADYNEVASTVTGGVIAGCIGKPPREIGFSLPYMHEDLTSCLERRAAVRREEECVLPGSTGPRRLVLTYGFIPSDMVILHTEDVSAQRQTEDQLRVSQRLEAVGRLAGGVAHDFNNMLSIIINMTAFAIEALDEGSPIREDLEEVRTAGQRAAALTRQLLAFSRKQILQPEVVNLNLVVAGFEGMLRRLLGEDIVVATRLAKDLGLVLADPGQIEQVIMNLAVNARDAMPAGGRLTMETANVELDDTYAHRHLAVGAGRHVMLAISDTGCGMDAATRERIFEPFFTTKEKGKGTGLGLSTVYGIVKQSGGNIWVYSEPGRGTTFKVYLPCVTETTPPVPRRTTPARSKGSETILIVEDEDAVRGVAERILKAAGYRVLSASGGEDALRVEAAHRGEVDLLLTDVVMPQMNGRDLAERLKERSPRIKVLFTSGYTDNAIVHHGVLDSTARFISKPFAAADLTAKVREVLDEES